MDTKAYAAIMEKKLTQEFREKFYSKMGYYPIVTTRTYEGNQSNGSMPLMSLMTLQEHFRPFLPDEFGRKVHLACKSRLRSIVELRNIYCVVAREMGYGLKEIGKSLGNRDHTTVIHNVRSCKNLLETCETFRKKYYRIVETIKHNHESSTMDYADQIQHQPEPALLP